MMRRRNTDRIDRRLPSGIATAAWIIVVTGSVSSAHGGDAACEGHWSAIPSPFTNHPSESGLLMLIHDAGDGPKLFHALNLTSSDGSMATVFQRWDGSQWAMPNDGLKYPGFTVDAASMDIGQGPTLYLGGLHWPSSTPGAFPLWKWRDEETSRVGEESWMQSSVVNALVEFDDGNSPALYAAGTFDKADGVAANNVAKWDGEDWSALHSGFEMADGSGVSIWALDVYDDGNGERLIAGGKFDTASGNPIANLAMWDNEAGRNGRWIDLGGSADDVVYDMAVIDGELYVAGAFTMIGGAATNGLARWDGNTWSALPGPEHGSIFALEVVDDGLSEKPGLYLAGEFFTIDRQIVNHIARYDPVTNEVTSLGDGVSGGPTPFIDRITSFDFGDGPRVYVTGFFEQAGNDVAWYIAEWTPQNCDVPGDLNGDGVVDIHDMLILIGVWGPCDEPNACPADLTGPESEPDGVVDVFDLLHMIANWG